MMFVGVALYGEFFSLPCDARGDRDNDESNNYNNNNNNYNNNSGNYNNNDNIYYEATSYTNE